MNIVYSSLGLNMKILNIDKSDNPDSEMIEFFHHLYVLFYIYCRIDNSNLNLSIFLSYNQLSSLISDIFKRIGLPTKLISLFFQYLKIEEIFLIVWIEKISNSTIFSFNLGLLDKDYYSDISQFNHQAEQIKYNNFKQCLLQFNYADILTHNFISNYTYQDSWIRYHLKKKLDLLPLNLNLYLMNMQLEKINLNIEQIFFNEDDIFEIDLEDNIQILVNRDLELTIFNNETNMFICNHTLNFIKFYQYVNNKKNIHLCYKCNNK
jgi:hypothetical protein